jgi:hypothetical protein
MATEAKPPNELGPEGKRLWRSVARAVAEDDLELTAPELAWLRTACKLGDRAAQLEAAMNEQPLVVKGYNGQPVINSIWGEWRLVCQLQATTLARIRLDLPGADAGGLQDVVKINKQRMGANRRWGREA